MLTHEKRRDEFVQQLRPLDLRILTAFLSLCFYSDRLKRGAMRTTATQTDVNKNNGAAAAKASLAQQLQANRVSKAYLHCKLQ